MIDISKIKKLADEIESEVKKQFGDDVGISMDLWLYAGQSKNREDIIKSLHKKWKLEHSGGSYWFKTGNHKQEIVAFI
jgi:hypothetical protein